MSKGGSKTQTQSTALDPATQAYVDQLRQAAIGASGSPIYGQAAQAGQMGLAALTGQPGAVNSLMNPYSETLNPYWDVLRGKTLNAIGDQASLAGAFGGSRQGVAEGQGLADIANAQAGQRYGEFNSAMARAAQLANLGFGAPAAQLDLLRSGIGPFGMQATTTEKTKGDLFSQLLGLGTTAATLFK